MYGTLGLNLMFILASILWCCTLCCCQGGDYSSETPEGTKAEEIMKAEARGRADMSARVELAKVELAKVEQVRADLARAELSKAHKKKTQMKKSNDTD